MVGIMFIIMLALIFVGVPVAFSILGSGIWFLLATDMKPLALVCQRAVTGLDSFPLLAVPLFVFVGDLMDRGGISRRMIRWAESFLGWMPGGLGVVTIGVMRRLCGSDWLRARHGGSHREHHDPVSGKEWVSHENGGGHGGGRRGAGTDYPASIPMIIYGVTMGVSIPQMFVAGIVPGLLLAALLILVNLVIAVKNPEILRHRGTSFSIKEVLKNTWSALGALLLPVIILGGIYSGVFTPTESAAVGVVYACL